MKLFWTILIIGFTLIEASTAQLVCIWFAGGALIGLVCALLGADIYVQITMSVIFSVVLLLLTKKIVQRLKNGKNEKTNVDALLGKSAVVTENISNAHSEGACKVGGIVWSARSENGKEISEGSLVTIERVEGVKLIVKEEE